MGLNTGVRFCPHGWPVNMVVGADGWAKEIAPEKCRLCEPNKVLEHYRLGGEPQTHALKAVLRPARGAMGLFSQDAT